MRKMVFVGAAVAALGAVPAAAQSSMIADVTAQTVMSMADRAPPEKCFDGRWSPKPAEIAAGQALVETVMHQYQQLAAAGTDVSPAFIKDVGMRHWLLDGIGVDVRAARDPWAGRIVRIEPVAFTAGNLGAGYHAQWQAIATNGTVLGLYDALVYRKGDGARLRWLDLHSPADKRTPMANAAFCETPGDVEEWRAAKAEIAAKRAARRAAKEAARVAGQQ